MKSVTNCEVKQPIFWTPPCLCDCRPQFCICFRKAVKATLILIPLLGLHWILTIYRPHPDGSAGSCHLTFIFNHLNVALDGCQGLAVALAFCYMNSEVN